MTTRHSFHTATEQQRRRESSEPGASDQDGVECFAEAESPSEAGRGGRKERWEEREEVGALSLVPLTETRYLTPEDERKEESQGEERKMRRRRGRRRRRRKEKRSPDLQATDRMDTHLSPLHIYSSHSHKM